jgi:hypothetical protein
VLAIYALRNGSTNTSKKAASKISPSAPERRFINLSGIPDLAKRNRNTTALHRFIAKCPQLLQKRTGTNYGPAPLTVFRRCCRSVELYEGGREPAAHPSLTRPIKDLEAEMDHSPVIRAHFLGRKLFRLVHKAI